MITMKTGNIFTSDCDTIVNTVNCQGVMGAGIALEFKWRYPNMFEKYQALCKNNQIQIGKLWNYKVEPERLGFKYVLSLPTKDSWKMPSKLEYLESALKKFVGTYKDSPYNSVAFPVLGGGRGGLDESEVIDLMYRYLSKCSINIEIWKYQSDKEDDLYPILEQVLTESSPEEFGQRIGLTSRARDKVYQAMLSPKVNSISAISAQPGVGEKTLAKLIVFCTTPQPIVQNTSLF